MCWAADPHKCVTGRRDLHGLRLPARRAHSAPSPLGVGRLALGAGQGEASDSLGGGEQGTWYGVRGYGERGYVVWSMRFGVWGMGYRV